MCSVTFRVRDRSLTSFIAFRTLVRRMQQLCAPSSVAPDLSAAAAAAEIDSLCTQEVGPGRRCPFTRCR